MARVTNKELAAEIGLKAELWAAANGNTNEMPQGKEQLQNALIKAFHAGVMCGIDATKRILRDEAEE